MLITHNEIRRHPAWRDELAMAATPSARRIVVDRQLLSLLTLLGLGAALAIGLWFV